MVFVAHYFILPNIIGNISRTSFWLSEKLMSSAQICISIDRIDMIFGAKLFWDISNELHLLGFNNPILQKSNWDRLSQVDSAFHRTVHNKIDSYL